MKSKTILIIIVVILSIALGGAITYIVIDHLIDEIKENNNIHDKDDYDDHDDYDDNDYDDFDILEEKERLNNEEALEIGTFLYNKLVSYFYDGEAIQYDTDSSKYINDCEVGIGCMPITNFNEISKYLTNDAIKDLANHRNSIDFGIRFINNKPYIIDGYNKEYELKKYELSVMEIENDEIDYNVLLYLNDEFNSEKRMVKEYKIEYINNMWKVEEF